MGKVIPAKPCRPHDPMGDWKFHLHGNAAMDGQGEAAGWAGGLCGSVVWASWLGRWAGWLRWVANVAKRAVSYKSVLISLFFYCMGCRMKPRMEPRMKPRMDQQSS